MSSKYNLAIIAGQLVVGGAERQLYLWLSHIDRAKFSPIVLTLHPGYGDYWEDPIESLGIPLIRIPRRRNRVLRAFNIVNVSNWPFVRATSATANWIRSCWIRSSGSFDPL